MKLRVAFTVEITPAQKKALLTNAEARGYRWDDASDNVVIKRFLAEHGSSAIDLPTEDEE